MVLEGVIEQTKEAIKIVHQNSVPLFLSTAIDVCFKALNIILLIKKHHHSVCLKKAI